MATEPPAPPPSSRLPESEPDGGGQILSLNSQDGTTTSLQQQLVHLPRGAHVCVIYTMAAEQMRSVVPFLRDGIRHREECLYLGDASDVADLLGGLEIIGREAHAAIRRGELIFETTRDTYLRSGQFDPRAMIEFLLAKAEIAREQGWAGLRVVGDMSWALRPETSNERLVEYEARLNDLTSATAIRSHGGTSCNRMGSPAALGSP